MWHDPIVDEVRREREKIAARWAKDPAAHQERQAQLFRNWKGGIISKTQLDRERSRQHPPHDS